MKRLEQLISSKNVGELFENIHAMIAVVESDGSLVSWNHAFGVYKKIFPTKNKLSEFFAQKDRHLIDSNLAKKSRKHWVAEFVFDEGEQSGLCDCVLIPMVDDQILFIAEKIETNPVFQQLVERLNRRVKLFRIESESAKKIARNKQIEMEAVMVQAREVAQIDALTFLLNRRMIVRELQDEVLRANRYHSTLSISVIDIDNFKAVNDTYGHAVGDEVLKQVAIQLRDHIRHPDIAGRYGGEEFIILLPNSDSNAAMEQATRLCKQVRETVVTIKEFSLSVTISIGIAQFKDGVDTWDTLLNRADNAMYEAKKKGRDRWAVVD
jgi:diguanylate cyclase (GGDEF)-like protein